MIVVRIIGSMKISYAVLHWNRPYFALAHIELARRYFDFVDKFVLLDDCSDTRCMPDLVKNYDEVISSSTNVSEWEKGSVSNLINKFLTNSDSDIVIFAEDDFLPCPCFFKDGSKLTTLNIIPPDVVFPDKNTNLELKNNIHLILDNSIYLQLAKSNYGWKKLKTVNSDLAFMDVISDYPARSYSNWPWAMSLEMAKKVFLEITDLHIWQIEQLANKNLLEIPGSRNMCVNMRNHLHAGFICTTRKDEYDNSFNVKRKRSLAIYSKKSPVPLNEIRSKFLESYIGGKRLSVKKMIKSGIYSSINDFIS